MTKFRRLFACLFLKITFSILFLSCAVKPIYAQDTPLKFSYLTVDNGLSHTDTKDLCQDKRGFIWVATLFGLDRYDGYVIKRYYNSNVPKNNALKNRVRGISPDQYGRLWLATDGGIQCFDSKAETYTDYETGVSLVGNDIYTKILTVGNDELAIIVGGKFKRYKIKDGQLFAIPTPVMANIIFFDMVTKDHNRVFISSDCGLFTLDPNGSLIHLRLSDSSGKHFNRLTKIMIDRQNRLIMINGKELQRSVRPVLGEEQTQGNLNTAIIATTSFTLPGPGTIKDLIQDQRLDYWMASDMGLYNLSSSFKLKRIVKSSSFVNSLNTNYLDKLFIDRSECLWICTFGGGVNYCDLNAKLFYTLQNNPKEANSVTGDYIRAILEQDVTHLWIGTNANGLNEYNSLTRKFTAYSSAAMNLGFKSDEVRALILDNARNLWVGSDKGIDILNASHKALLHPPGAETFPQTVNALNKDKFGNIWFCTADDSLGCIWQNHKTGRYTVTFHGFGHYIWADTSRAELMIGSTNGLRHLYTNERSEILKSYSYSNGNQGQGLSSNYTWPVQKQNDSTYWIGTLGGGLNCLRLQADHSYHITQYGKRYGIFNDVESLEIDKSGKIWMGGKGLECFNPSTLGLTKYDKKDGLQGNSFKVGSSFRGKGNKLYFGGISGMNYFYPDSIKRNTISACPVITDLIVNNQQLLPAHAGISEASLGQGISYGTPIVLSHLQNNFVLSFSAMHFANPLKCLYRYKLTGFDQGWQYTTGSNPSASYSNLYYRKYLFTVQATNNDGLWSKNTAAVAIDILPPWYLSLLAEIIYTLVFLSILAGIYIYQARWFRLKREVAIRDIQEKKREEMHLQREELYQQQLQFFTNISHEFRTPLTLIFSPLENLLSEKLYPAGQHTFEVMFRNARRLMNLINELMNFTKVADNIIGLRVSPLKLNVFTNDILTEFEDLALARHIDFSVDLAPAPEETWLDEQVVEKILFNLLNNAFKYTASGGKVKLAIFFELENFQPAYEPEFKLLNPSRAEQYIYFRVIDTGIGISKESISLIFDRYYRVSHTHIGSGIGLALVKSLTLLHKGDIYVYSERLAGTEIIIALPWQKEVFSASEQGLTLGSALFAKLEKIDNSFTPQIEEINISENGLTGLAGLADLTSLNGLTGLSGQPAGKYHILIVEDNDELRAFLKQLLQQKYVVYEACDGQQGFEMAMNWVPDLIISDVMMPVMNGIELCQKIKQQLETSHIPFLILSAKDALESRLEGLESGADYYFSKPLSTEFLQLTIHNIFEQKEKLKLRYTGDYYTEATELVHSAKDKEFIEKLILLIEKNIQAPELDVDYLCRELYTSRSKLYQKIKNISGQSIGDFIRTARLKKAVYLMTHEDISISELIERIGFTSTSYFSKAFKKEFGHAPSEFLKSVKKTAAGV